MTQPFTPTPTPAPAPAAAALDALNPAQVVITTVGQLREFAAALVPDLLAAGREQGAAQAPEIDSWEKGSLKTLQTLFGVERSKAGEIKRAPWFAEAVIQRPGARHWMLNRHIALRLYRDHCRAAPALSSHAS